MVPGSFLDKLKISYLSKLTGVLIMPNDRLKEHPFKSGQIGGHCDYNPSPIKNTKAHRMSLSSWYSISFSNFNFPE